MSNFFKSEVFKICVYVFGAITFGALLAPLLFSLAKGAEESGKLNGLSFLGLDLQAEIARASFGRVFNRAMMLGALLGIWPLIRWIGLRPREFLQLQPNPRRWSHLGVSFTLAAGGLLLLGWVLTATGVFTPGNAFIKKTLQARTGESMIVSPESIALDNVETLDPALRFQVVDPDGGEFQNLADGARIESFTLQQLLGGEVRFENLSNEAKPFVKLAYLTDFNPVNIIFMALLAGLCVAFLEEFFFRGCLLGLAVRNLPKLAALGFVSAFFSFVHFLTEPAGLTYPDPISWTTGFWYVGQIFAQFGNPIFILAEFTTLFIVGWILGYARLRTNSLWIPIGLHAGWVFGIKTFSDLTRRAIPSEDTMPWIGPSLRSGLASVAMLALTGVVVWFWLRRIDRRQKA